MTHAAIIEEMAHASASMDVARDAAERGDWPKAGPSRRAGTVRPPSSRIGFAGRLRRPKEPPRPEAV